MQFGLHLPQFGRVATPGAISESAIGAEKLGFADVWVSDHQVAPVDQPYPPARLLDPLSTLLWAAAATTTIRVGTSVMVVPQYSTVALANTVASLDLLSEGRVVFGAGIGWLEPEYEALGFDFSNRGKRMDECLDVLRICWRDDPLEFDGEFHQIHGLRQLPKPERDIPIWVGGSSEPAYRRAVTKGDGFHGGNAPIEEMTAIVERLRADRPEPEFTISVRTDWDGLGTDASEITSTLDAWSDLGVQHVMATPVQRTAAEWLGSAEALAKLFEKYRSDS